MIKDIEYLIKLSKKLQISIFKKKYNNNNFLFRSITKINNDCLNKKKTIIKNYSDSLKKYSSSNKIILKDIESENKVLISQIKNIDKIITILNRNNFTYENDDDDDDDDDDDKIFIEVYSNNEIL